DRCEPAKCLAVAQPNCLGAIGSPGGADALKRHPRPKIAPLPSSLPGAPLGSVRATRCDQHPYPRGRRAHGRNLCMAPFYRTPGAAPLTTCRGDGVLIDWKSASRVIMSTGGDRTTVLVCLTCRGSGDPLVEPRPGQKLATATSLALGDATDILVRGIRCLG